MQNKKWVIISRRLDYTLLGVMVGVVLLEYWLGPDPGPRWYRNAKLGVAVAMVPVAIFCVLRLRRFTATTSPVRETAIQRVCCKNCGYSLENLTKNRCPECGRTFDPNDPSTFRPTRWTATRTHLLVVVGALSFLFFVAVNMAYLNDSAPPSPSLMIRIAVSIACLQTMFAVCAFEVFMRWRHRKPRE